MRLLRTLLVAMLLSLAVGLAIGTWLRMRLEQPVQYIGLAGALPLDVADARAPVLDPRHHEQQIA